MLLTVSILLRRQGVLAKPRRVLWRRVLVLRTLREGSWLAGAPGLQPRVMLLRFTAATTLVREFCVVGGDPALYSNSLVVS